MRIVTGTAKGRALKSPNIPEFRAVQDVAKMSAFSILGDKVKNATVLDLFSGSGNLGIESLSRGAKWVDFVDGDKKATMTILENIQKCGFSDNYEIFLKDAVKYAGNSANLYDIVFLDPFYKDVNHVFLMQNLEQILNPDGIVVFFHGDNLDIQSLISKTSFKVFDERRFGKSFVTFLK